MDQDKVQKYNELAAFLDNVSEQFYSSLYTSVDSYVKIFAEEKQDESKKFLKNEILARVANRVAEQIEKDRENESGEVEVKAGSVS